MFEILKFQIRDVSNDASFLFHLPINCNLVLVTRGKSGRLWSCTLGFDSESGQTNNFKIGIHSFPA